MKFTVLLMYPDRYGDETFLAHIVAHDPEGAIAQAQRVACKGMTTAAPDEFRPLFVTAGHLDDLSP